MTVHFGTIYNIHLNKYVNFQKENGNVPPKIVIQRRPLIIRYDMKIKSVNGLILFRTTILQVF